MNDGRQGEGGTRRGGEKYVGNALPWSLSPYLPISPSFGVHERDIILLLAG